MIQIKRKYEEKNERRPHVGNCAAGRQITPFHHRGFYSTPSPGHLLALTVHKDVSSLPSTPRVSVGSSPFDDCKLLEAC